MEPKKLREIFFEMITFIHLCLVRLALADHRDLFFRGVYRDLDRDAPQLAHRADELSVSSHPFTMR